MATVTETTTEGGNWVVTLDSEGVLWRLSFTCPTCNRRDSVTLQPLPWHTPILEDDEDADADGLSESDRIVRRHQLEQRRATEDGIPHEEVNSITTQLWCHLDQIGREVVVSI